MIEHPAYQTSKAVRDAAQLNLTRYWLGPDDRDEASLSTRPDTASRELNRRGTPTQSPSTVRDFDPAVVRTAI